MIEPNCNGSLLRVDYEQAGENKRMLLFVKGAFAEGPHASHHPDQLRRRPHVAEGTSPATGRRPRRGFQSRLQFANLFGIHALSPKTPENDNMPADFQERGKINFML
ncbi:MAG: hypothetical protein NTY19_09415 [Planctomycetota bacterium]|nr:hypothetical protein [Planctomycetota bacterium]